MRISTSNFYNNTTVNLNNLQGTISNLSNEISTGKKGLTPQDDPAAVVKIMNINQVSAQSDQFAKNRVSLNNTLGVVSNSIESMINNLGSVNEQIILGKNGTLSTTDQATIAQTLQGQLDELVDLSNTTDGSGHYLFGGFNVANKPVGDSSVATAIKTASTASTATISSVKTIAINQINNSDLSPAAKADAVDTVTTLSNLYTATGTVGVGGTSLPTVANFATDLIGALSVSSSASPPTYTLAGLTATSAISGTFQPDAGTDVTKLITAGPGGALTFSLNSLSNGALKSSVAIPVGMSTSTISSGAVVSYNQYNYQGSIDASNQITTSDVQVDSGTYSGVHITAHDLFGTNSSGSSNFLNQLSKTIAVLKDTSHNQADVQSVLQDLAASYETTFSNVLKAQSQVGITQNQLSSLDSLNASKNLENTKELSSLEDTDYNKTLSDLSRNQLALTAAQKSFQQISNLSLFNYIN
jgi:flagellar hook-associated protein 3 FlgL